METYKRLLFIINPNAGIMRRENKFKEVVMTFADHGYETLVCYTRRQGDGTVLVKEHAGSDIELIVCMGGDGTLNEVIAGCISIGWEKKLGYIPAGSTNDFAASLGIPAEPDEAAKVIMNGSSRKIDIGRFNGRTFVYTATAGLFSRISYETPQKVKNMLGHFAYVMGGIKDMNEFVPIEMSIEADGKLIEDEYALVSFCNTFSLGGVVSLDRELVDLSDGFFELLLIKAPKDIMEMDIIRRSLVEQDYSTPLVRMIKVKKALIACKATVDWSLDGEFSKGTEVNKFEVLEGAVSILC